MTQMTTDLFFQQQKIALFYEDQHLVVLSKPPNLLSQGDHSEASNLVDLLRQAWGRPYVGLVHRLDRNTSGLMVVAKRSKAASRLSEALVAGKLERHYLGWLVGHLPQPVQWRHLLKKNPHTNQVQVIAGPTAPHPSQAGFQQASLQATPRDWVRWQNTPLTLCEFCLQTGRSHQIRAQAAFEGLPLLGDRKYSSPLAPHSPAFPRHALHSWQLRFPHPMSGLTLSFQDPLPPDLKLTDSLSTEKP